MGADLPLRRVCVKIGEGVGGISSQGFIGDSVRASIPPSICICSFTPPPLGRGRGRRPVVASSLLFSPPPTRALTHLAVKSPGEVAPRPPCQRSRQTNRGDGALTRAWNSSLAAGGRKGGREGARDDPRCSSSEIIYLCILLAKLGEFWTNASYHIAVVGKMPSNDERRILQTYQRYSRHYKSYGSLLLLMPTRKGGSVEIATLVR